MDKAALRQIIGAFSGRELEDFIISYAREKFFSGDWGSAEAIVEHLLAAELADGFKARVALFGVFIAAKARNGSKAVARYRVLEALAPCETNVCLKAVGLAHLSELLLPGEASLLAGLWLKAVQTALPGKAREKYAAIGAALGEHFSEIRDSQNLEKIASIMRSFPDSGMGFEKRRRFNIPREKQEAAFTASLADAHASGAPRKRRD